MHFIYQHTLFGVYINALILLFLQRVLLLVASDVDALCACKILQVSLGSLSLQADMIRKHVCSKHKSHKWVSTGERGRFNLLL